MPIAHASIAFVVALLVSVQGGEDTRRLGAAVRRFIESYGDQAGAEPRPSADPLEFRYALSDLSGDGRSDAVVIVARRLVRICRLRDARFRGHGRRILFRIPQHYRE